VRPIEPVALAAVLEARERLSGVAVRTPLLRLELHPEDLRPFHSAPHPLDRVAGAGPHAPGGAPGGPAPTPPAAIHLKLENLQPIGSFKIRGAGNAMRSQPRARLAGGVWTPSAGNMAQGVAWNARALGVPCTAVVPEHAPGTKIAALDRLGARILRASADLWWQAIVSHRFEGADGVLVHPVSDPAVIAGNGTIGLEILEDLPGVDTILVPYGGGGLSIGIASAVRSLQPGVRIVACEVETAAPLAAALAAGAPQEIVPTPSFVDGVGGRSVLAEMWPAARLLLDGTLVVSLEEVAAAIRLLVERAHVVAEGAAAAAVAAALSGRAGGGSIACVVSGGNIDAAVLATILGGQVPQPAGVAARTEGKR
jgi:threonine dehydratase